MLAEELRQALSQNQQLTSQLDEHSTQSIQVCRLSLLLPALKQLMLRSDPAFPAEEEFHGIFFEDFLQWALAWCVRHFTHQEVIGTTRQSAACQQSSYSRNFRSLTLCAPSRTCQKRALCRGESICQCAGREGAGGRKAARGGSGGRAGGSAAAVGGPARRGGRAQAAAWPTRRSAAGGRGGSCSHKLCCVAPCRALLATDILHPRHEVLGHLTA